MWPSRPARQSGTNTSRFFLFFSNADVLPDERVFLQNTSLLTLFTGSRGFRDILRISGVSCAEMASHALNSKQQHGAYALGPRTFSQATRFSLRITAPCAPLHLLLAFSRVFPRFSSFSYSRLVIVSSSSCHLLLLVTRVQCFLRFFSPKIVPSYLSHTSRGTYIPKPERNPS